MKRLLADRSEGGHVAARPCVRARCSNFPEKVALKGTPPITSLNFQTPVAYVCIFRRLLYFLLPSTFWFPTLYRQLTFQHSTCFLAFVYIRLIRRSPAYSSSSLCDNMPGRTLPTIPQADVASHNTTKSCYVTVGTKVYDITPFLDDHPGGGDLIVEYGGKDVQDIMDDTTSHFHSESAWEILDDYLVGFVATEAVMKSVTDSTHPADIVPLPPSDAGAEQLRKDGVNQPLYQNTGMSSADDLSKETDASSDYRTHKFLDLNKPLLMQVWRGGFTKEFYLEQVHRPRHYKGGDSAPLFGNFLEPLSKTPWWVVPTVWLPQVAYGTYLSGRGLSTVGLTSYWITGLFIWTLVEYVLHRFLFHLDQHLPDNRAALTLHFLLHGIHHYLPMDRLRLVMPPTLFLALATPFWYLAHAVFFYDWNAATAVFCGGIFGYVCYDLTHYFLHHKT
jgi:4-hydroxysphinganine ceramide fatty acyl 2-hydroxylase